DGKNETVLASIMKVASIIGSSEVIMLITVAIGLYFLMRRHWRHFFFFFVLSVGGVILYLALKMFIQRTRLVDEDEMIRVFNDSLLASFLYLFCIISRWRHIIFSIKDVHLKNTFR